MKKSRFTKSQIVASLKEWGAGVFQPREALPEALLDARCIPLRREVAGDLRPRKHDRGDLRARYRLMVHLIGKRYRALVNARLPEFARALEQQLVADGFVR